MTISIRIDRKAGKLNAGHLARVKTQFYKGAAEMLPFVIKDTILKGISPVRGVGRFQKYSKSYIDQIEGRVRFVRMNGVVRAIKPELKVVREKLYGAEFNRGATRGKPKNDSYRKGTTSKISFAQSFEKGLGVGKVKSPVNMSVRGEMLKTLSSKATNDYTDIFFKSPIAKFHNDLGAGKSKVIRPLLPTKPGQRFSDLINRKLNDLLRSLLGFK